MPMASVLPILKMEEEDPNRGSTRAHFQRLSPMAVAYVLPILKMEEEDPNRDPTRAHFQRLSPMAVAYVQIRARKLLKPIV